MSIYVVAISVISPLELDAIPGNFWIHFRLWTLNWPWKHYLPLAWARAVADLGGGGFLGFHGTTLLAGPSTERY